MSQASYLLRRRGTWYFVRRIPLELQKLDRRSVVKQSTKIEVADDPKGIRAGKIVDQHNRELEAYWRGLADGHKAEAQARYDDARRRARTLGFEYAPATEVADRRLAEVLARVERLVDPRASDRDVAAVLGGEAKPVILLSALFVAYKEIERASITDFSEDQLRKWTNPRLRAIANLVSVIGDKSIADISRGDALDFRAWWQDRVIGGLQIDSANKDIGHINKMLVTVDRAHRLGLQPNFAQLRIAGGEENSRPPFDLEFLRDIILKPGALDDINGEARDIIYIVAETGMRPVEVCNLGPSTIALGHKVPHVLVRADGRRMKTPQSKRDVPLVGVALQAMRRHPEGFPRYRDNADSFSAAANKFLRTHRMLPTEDHTVYSLRHTFEDRLTAIEPPEKVIAYLMGHKYSRPKYGAGPSLAQTQKWLQRIAFKVPSIV